MAADDHGHDGYVAADYGIGIDVQDALILMDTPAGGAVHVIAHMDEIVGIVRITLAGDADTLGLQRDVHIVKITLFQQLMLLEEVPDPVHALQSHIVGSPGGGEGNGGNAQRHSLAHGTHSAGVHDVQAYIEAIIYAGDHQVNFQLQAQKGKPDAICRGGIHSPDLNARLQLHLHSFEGLMQFNAMALTALLKLRHYSGDLAQLLAPPDQGQQLGSADAIVVGN